ncbi:hypothetical protein ACFLQU_01340 [Verrucomicrobiota bacterium]
MLKKTHVEMVQHFGGVEWDSSVVYVHDGIAEWTLPQPIQSKTNGNIVLAGYSIHEEDGEYFCILDFKSSPKRQMPQMLSFTAIVPLESHERITRALLWSDADAIRHDQPPTMERATLDISPIGDSVTIAIVVTGPVRLTLDASHDLAPVEVNIE